jgi:hypothetical protein
VASRISGRSYMGRLASMGTVRKFQHLHRAGRVEFGSGTV